MTELKLCYVNPPWAYFTTQPLTDQWGDDWNDAPYEHNAGDPYRWHNQVVTPYEIRMVAYDSPLQTPAQLAHHGNSSYSVEQINAGAVAWLAPDQWDAKRDLPSIPAGTTLEEFKRLIKLSGGDVYEQTT